MTGEMVRIELELEVDAETVCGRISGPGLPDSAFYGWLELAGRIDAARHGASAATAARRFDRETPGDSAPLGPAPGDP